jgi:hypothetical protein
VALSAIVRWRPARTAVNGTVAARPARTTVVGLAVWAPARPQGEARPGDPCLVGKGHRPAAGVGGIRTQRRAASPSKVVAVNAL